MHSVHEIEEFSKKISPPLRFVEMTFSGFNLTAKAPGSRP